MTKAKAKTALDKAIGSVGISDVKTGRTSSNRVAKSEDALMRERVEAITPAARKSGSKTSKSEREFLANTAFAEPAAALRSAQARRSRIIDDENEKIAQDRRVVHFDVPAGAVDVNHLVELLVSRLAPGQVIVGTGLGGGGGIDGTGFGGGGGGIDGTGFGGGASNIPTIRGQITESGRNYDGQKIKGALPASAPGPLETEVEALSNKLTVLHSLITELDSSLEPLLAHESDSEVGDEMSPSRSSESPHHQRLIDLGEGLDRALTRLRYTQSRVRT